MKLPNKQQVLAALKARVDADLEAATLAWEQAVEAATHVDCRAEHAKDMRSTEASYLARGLAQRVVELREVAVGLDHPQLQRAFDGEGGDPIALGALVGTEDADGQTGVLLMVSSGGGLQVEVDGTTVRVVTPSSPLGQALVGAELDEELVVRTPGGDRELTIVAIG